MNYDVNIESLQKNFPSDFQVPSLLLDFGRWLKDKLWGSLGCFSLHSERFDDFWIENGADLHENFAFFIRDPTGGQIGYWLYDGRSTVTPPIVLVGSEGELAVLSETLEEFLQQLAEGNTQVLDLDSRDQDGGSGAELAKWLDAHSNNEPHQSAEDHPDLEQWMEKWGQKQRKGIDEDPIYMQIADKLRKFVKPNAQPWEFANFDVLLVGTQFKMWHRSFGPQPMPHDEVSDLESLFRTAREHRAKKIPERGLWFSAWVSVGLKGGVYLRCNFLNKPEILGEEPIISMSDYQLDLKTFPRSQHWTPEWLLQV